MSNFPCPLPAPQPLPFALYVLQPPPPPAHLLLPRDPATESSSATGTASNGCVVCADPPECPVCPSDQVCNLSAQSCDACSVVSCVNTTSTFIDNGSASSSTSTPVPTTSTSSNLLGPLIGGIAGAIILLSIATFLIFYFRRKRKQPSSEKEVSNDRDSPSIELHKPEYAAYAKTANNNLIYPQQPQNHPLRPPGRTARSRYERPISDVTEEDFHNENDYATAHNEPLSLQQQLDYIKYQQIKLQREELKEQQRLNSQHSQQTLYRDSTNSRNTNSSIIANDDTLISRRAHSSSSNSAYPQSNTSSSQNLSSILAQEAVTLSRTGTVSPAMAHVLQNIPSNELKDKMTPYDAYLRYVADQGANNKPSPSSSLRHLGHGSSASESSSCSAEIRDGRASHVIPIAYIPGVTSNFSQSPSKPQFASHLTRPNLHSPHSPRSPRSPLHETTDANFDTRSSMQSFAPVRSAMTAARAQPQLIIQAPPSLGSSKSSPSAVSPFSRVRYPSTLEPTAVARSNMLKNPPTTARNSEISVAPDLDHRPAELQSSQQMAPSTGFLDSDASSVDSKGYDDELYNEIEAYLGGAGDHLSMQTQSEDTSRLQPFEYPVLFSPSDDISFIGERR